MICQLCGAENDQRATVCVNCNEAFPRQQDTSGDATGGVIPYKNLPALFAYYLGLFSLFPLLGLPIGIAAFVLGILGLRKRRENPAVKGSAHAWIGIGCGGIMAIIWGGAILLGIIVALNEKS